MKRIFFGLVICLVVALVIGVVLAVLQQVTGINVMLYYAPKILGGRDARKGVAGEGARRWDEVIRLRDVEWRRLGPDLFTTARVVPPCR